MGNESSMLNAFLLQLKLAENENALNDVRYRAFRHPAITGKQLDLITNLTVYKKNYLDGKNEDELKDCAKALKIPAKYTKQIIWSEK